MSTVYVFAVLATLLAGCKGLRCWNCENEDNNSDCMLNGKLQQCSPSQRECQNEIRSIANDRFFKITKRCKQDIGCDNNRKQNELHTNSYRCEERDTVNVCWCCCTGDNCNGPEVFCQKIDPKCDDLNPPLNGLVRCQKKDNSLGTNCVYRCLPGFQLVGTSRTTCVRNRFAATWSTSAPTCKPVTCDSVPESPKDGSVSCSEGNNWHSTCRFTCDRDFILFGARTTTCSHLGLWSEPVPKCIQVSCRVPSNMDENLQRDCSNGENLGSYCRFSCPSGFEVKGLSEVTCGEPIKNRFGRWTGRFPTCVRTGCEEPKDSPTTDKECTSGNAVGSICTYTCSKEDTYMTSSDDAADILSDRTAAITCSEDRGWTSSPPVCRPSVCPQLTRSFSNGNRLCSRGNRIGSVCSFDCDSGFQLLPDVGSISCQRGLTSIKGEWSLDEPKCSILTGCEEPKDSPTTDKECTSGNAVGSICTYTCSKEDTYMTSSDDAADILSDGTVAIECNEDRGWTSSPPVCRPTVCPQLTRSFSNGSRLCSRDNRIGSICSFDCDSGFQLLPDVGSISCQRGLTSVEGEWSLDEPKCSTRYECPEPDDSGATYKNCTDGNFEGSSCSYFCEIDEFIASADDASIIEESDYQINCIRDVGWDGSPPVCRPIFCPVLLSTFENGNRVCTRDIRIGSECSYTCDSGFRLTEEVTVQCVYGVNPGQGAWSSEEPRCAGGAETGPKMCPNYGPVANGEVSCEPVKSTNGTHWLEGATCGLSCSGAFLTPIGKFSTVRCRGGNWIGRLCCDACLSTRILDVIVLMDSSYVDDDLWEVSKSFNSDFALYLTENYGLELNFIFIPYSTSVDSSNIVETSNINFDNYQTLESSIDSMPFAGKGNSNTGRALKYVNEVTLKELTPESVPLVVILTNKRPRDNKLAKKEAEKLRNQRIHIRIVPLTDFFTANPRRNKAAFEAITGGEDNSVIDNDSVEDFYEVVSEGINNYETYCESRSPTC